MAYCRGKMLLRVRTYLEFMEQFRLSYGNVIKNYLIFRLSYRLSYN